MPSRTSALLGALFLGAFSFGVLASGCGRKGKTSEPTPAPAVSFDSVSHERPLKEAVLHTSDSSKAEVESRPAAPLNVVLITIDSLRADVFSGDSGVVAPNLTKLSTESVVYENHRSVSSYTAQTVATLMTGRFASTLYRTGTFFTNYFDDNVWITESMKEKGIFSIGVHAHLYFERAPGLRQGFDTWTMVPGLKWNSLTDESVTGVKSVDAMIDALSLPERKTGQFFVWAHLMDPHDQYVKHEGAPDFGKDNRGRYKSEIWFVDRELGRFLEFLEKQPFAKNTVIIVSADHGETFGEHAMYKHAFEIWEPLVRIPLIVKAPSAKAKRIKEARTHLDVAPTVVDLLGIAPLPSFQGKSLASEIYGATPENREPIFLELAEDTNNPARRAIIEGSEKLISFDGGAKQALFDLSSDPGESKDLARERPQRVKALAEKLSTYFDALPVVEPAGGPKLKGGKLARGPHGAKK